MRLITDIEELEDILQRRWRLILGVIGLGLAASLLLATAREPVYRAEEVLHIAPPRVAENLAATSVAQPLARQLPQLRHRVLGLTSLSEIENAYQLDSRTGPARGASLREAVNIAWSQPMGGQVEIIVSARLKGPEMAQLIAQELSHRLIRTSVQLRIAEANVTLEFLRAAETMLRNELEAVQNRYAAFRRANPETLGAEPQAEVPPVLAAEARGYERELTRLTGELDAAASRRQKAETGFLLERQRKSERLIVDRPAILPNLPEDDARLNIVIAGGAVSVAQAIALVLHLERRFPVLRNARRMRRLTGVTPIASIPAIPSPGWRQRLTAFSQRLWRKRVAPLLTRP